MEMKLKLGIHAQDISLYINCCFFLYSGRITTLVAMAAYSFHRLIMGKVQTDIFLSQSIGIFGFLFSRHVI